MRMYTLVICKSELSNELLIIVGLRGGMAVESQINNYTFVFIQIGECIKISSDI